MAGRIRAADWSRTVLGPAEAWPQALRTAVEIMLASPDPVSVVWGPERVQLYNDAYVPIAGERHPAALGRSVAENWSEAWDGFLGPIFARVSAGETVILDEQRVPLRTPTGAIDERFFTGSFLPIREAGGSVGGTFHPLIEVTARARADAELREREARLGRVLDGMAEGFSLLAADFTVLEHNREALRIDGQAREQVIGRSYWDAFPGSERSEAGRLLKQALASGRPASVEYHVPHDDERPCWLEVRAYPTADGMLGVFRRDVSDRKEAEQRLEETSRRLDAILANTRQAVFLMDERQQCVYANAAAEALTGYRAEAFTGRPLHDVVHHRRPDGSPYPIEECPIDRAFPERAQVSGEELFVHKDGHFYPVAFTASPLLDDDGRPVGTVIEARNIAEEKARDAALRELNERLEQRISEALAERKIFADAVESSSAAVTALDLEYTVLAINRANVEAFERGYGRRPSVGDNLIALLDELPEHQAQLKGQWSRALAGEEFAVVEEFGQDEPRTFEVRYGALRDEAGRQIGAASTSYDVTERVRAETRLAQTEAARREADALYRAYFENTPEAVFVIRVEPDGAFVAEQINPAHEANIGLKLEDIRGRRIEDILPPEVAEPVLATYRHVLATGAIHHSRDTYGLSGETRHWDTSIVPVRDGTGRIVRLIGASRNVTRQVAAEEALRQSQKMEAMGQLTGGVAHDFNNLLTPIIGSLDRLQRKGTGDERERRLVAGALQAAERAKTLVQRLLSFARRQPLQARAVDVGQLVRDMAGLIASTAGPQIQVMVEVPDALPAATADANQLEMALLNLCVNARDAMPTGGTLRITVSLRAVKDGTVGELRPGAYVCLSVADTGTGMDERTLQRAIEPFFSTKGVGQGTGLGLSMVHGLAAQLGGALFIHSQPGLGTNVELVLPQSANEADAGDDQTSCAVPHRSHGAALLVDDEELVRASTAEMLEELGYTVREAASAQEALAVMEQAPEIGLLVTDHLMPGMTGTELARLVLTRWPKTRTLIISGYAEAEGIAPELPRLTKPFRQADLAAKLSAMEDGAA